MADQDAFYQKMCRQLLQKMFETTPTPSSRWIQELSHEMTEGLSHLPNRNIFNSLKNNECTIEKTKTTLLTDKLIHDTTRISEHYAKKSSALTLRPNDLSFIFNVPKRLRLLASAYRKIQTKLPNCNISTSQREKADTACGDCIADINKICISFVQIGYELVHATGGDERNAYMMFLDPHIAITNAPDITTKIE